MLNKDLYSICFINLYSDKIPALSNAHKHSYRFLQLPTIYVCVYMGMEKHEAGEILKIHIFQMVKKSYQNVSLSWFNTGSKVLISDLALAFPILMSWKSMSTLYTKARLTLVLLPHFAKSLMHAGLGYNLLVDFPKLICSCPSSWRRKRKEKKKYTSCCFPSDFLCITNGGMH